MNILERLKPVAEMTEKEKVMERIREILSEYDNQEGKIPVRADHEYWKLANQYRSMK